MPVAANPRLGPAGEPFEIEPNAELVRLVRGAAAEVLLEPPPIVGVSYWADSAFIGSGTPTLLFGPRGEGAHAIEKWVDLSSTAAVAATLLGLATRFCG